MRAGEETGEENGEETSAWQLGSTPEKGVKQKNRPLTTDH